MKLRNLTAAICLMALGTVAIAAGKAAPQTAVKPTATSASESDGNFKAKPASAGVVSTIKTNFGKKLPDIGTVEEVLTTPLAGLYEVRLGRSIVYTDEKVEYIFNGHIMQSTGERKNFTKERLEALNLIDTSKLPLDDAIKSVKGDGSRKLFVFADPNCIYCKKFETSLKAVNNVTVYTYLFPILGEDSVVKTRDIWCSKDREKVFTDWMVNGKKPETQKDCDVSAITRTVKMGREMNVTGTPGVIFADGTRAPGAVPVDQLEKKWAELAKAGKK